MSLKTAKVAKDLWSHLAPDASSEAQVDNDLEQFGIGLKGAGHALDLTFQTRPGLKETVVQKMVMPHLNSKLVRTQDFDTMLMPTVSSMMLETRNEYTPYTNFLESQPGGAELTEDFAYQWHLWNIGSTQADWIDHQTETGSEAKSSRTVDSNTVGCLAVKIIMSDLVINQMSKQKGINILDKETSYAVTRLRNKLESILLSNTEVIFEGPVPSPRPAGLINKSNAATDMSGDDLTAPVLRGFISAIASIGDQQGRGYRQLMLMTNEQQLQVLRDINVNQFPGMYGMDRVAFENFLIKQMQAVNMNIVTIFESLLGPSVPGVLVPALPSGYSILTETAELRLVKMWLGDVAGPYAAMRPSEPFQRIEIVFDFVSQMTGNKAGRKVLSSVNT